MTAVPKQRHTKSKRNRRRGNIWLKKPVLIKCAKCNKPILPHIICANCGYYKGVEFIDTLKKLTKKERKAKEKEMAVKKAEEKKGASLNPEDLSKKI